MTEYFKSIPDLIPSLKRLKQEAWIDTDMEVWLTNPEKADFHYVPEFLSAVSAIALRVLGPDDERGFMEFFFG